MSVLGARQGFWLVSLWSLGQERAATRQTAKRVRPQSGFFYETCVNQFTKHSAELRLKGHRLWVVCFLLGKRWQTSGLSRFTGLGPLLECPCTRR